MISNLVDPPQGENYQALKGELFPTEYPITNLQDKITHNPSYFFLKYYITQRLFFSFAVKSQYCNYEVMINAFK